LNASTKGAEDGRLEPSLAWVHEEQEARRALPVKLQAASTTSVKEVRRPGTAPIEWRRHLLLWAGGASSGASATQGVPNEERSDWPASVEACESRRDALMPAAKAAAIGVE